jgi:hypothetical protein
MPSGSFQPDRSASLTSRGNGLAYDRVIHRWLPVDWRWVSDDGLYYAYAVYPQPAPAPGVSSTIHVVDARTGMDRLVLSTGQFAIVDYTGGAIYLTSWVGGHDGPGPQVGWALNPFTGAIQSLAGGAKYGYWVAGGAGWRTDYNPLDPTVHQGLTGPNRLIRVDVKSGAEVPWFYQQGADSVEVLGFDAGGNPIIASVIGSTWTMWQVPAAGMPVRLFSSSGFWDNAVADAHGIWFSGSQGTYLFVSPRRLIKISAVGGEIAGGCH